MIEQENMSVDEMIRDAGCPEEWIEPAVEFAVANINQTGIAAAAAAIWKIVRHEFFANPLEPVVSENDANIVFSYTNGENRWRLSFSTVGNDVLPLVSLNIDAGTKAGYEWSREFESLSYMIALLKTAIMEILEERSVTDEKP